MPICKNNTTIKETDEFIEVRLHGHLIVIYNKLYKEITLDTCGWNTPTTMRRMNECLKEFGFWQRVSKSSFAHTNELTMERVQPQ